MHRVAPSEKDTANATLEKRLRDAAEQAGPAPYPGLNSQEYSGGRLHGPLLGFIFLRLADVRFIARHVALTGQPSPGSASHALPVEEGRGEGQKIESHNGRFDFVLANPPFNVNSVDKEPLKDMVGSNRRFAFGLARTDNANYLKALIGGKLLLNPHPPCISHS